MGCGQCAKTWVWGVGGTELTSCRAVQGIGHVQRHGRKGLGLRTLYKHLQRFQTIHFLQVIQSHDHGFSNEKMQKEGG